MSSSTHPCFPLRTSLSRRGWWSLVAATLALVGALQSAGRAAPPAPAQAAEPTVELTIDYGDGVQKRFVGLPHKAGGTVLDALEAARRHPRGITFEQRGRGETAFLTRIDDLANEGRGKNWTYRVNDKPGDRSCGVYPLEAGDRVVWKFGVYRESP